MPATGDLFENPAWVTRALRENWAAIESRVGAALMPRLAAGTSERPRSIMPEEYGTGHYGTVMPTGTKDVVCKITSDPAEGSFVAAALAIGEIPTGMIRYDRIFALPGQHRNRPTFIIWRQEATRVGSMIEPSSFGRSRGYEGAEAFRLLLNTKDAGHMARTAILRNRKVLDEVPKHERFAWEFVGEHLDWIDGGQGGIERNLPTWLRGVRRLAVLLRFFEAGCEMMEHNNALTTNIGSALSFYYERGILLADVHWQNVGQIAVQYDDNDGDLIAGITDPGHAVFLTDKYDSVTVESVAADAEAAE